jgi:hypothetical protein
MAQFHPAAPAVAATDLVGACSTWTLRKLQRRWTKPVQANGTSHPKRRESASWTRRLGQKRAQETQLKQSQAPQRRRKEKEALRWRCALCAHRPQASSSEAQGRQIRPLAEEEEERPVAVVVVAFVAAHAASDYYDAADAMACWLLLRVDEHAQAALAQLSYEDARGCCCRE